ncbi:MAG: Hsp20/alpha crystallin family protein [Bacteroidota bacterium]
MKPLISESGIAALRREMDRIFDQFWGTETQSSTYGVWIPALDIADKGDALVAKVELPGVDPKEITVGVDDNVLTLSGEKKYEKEEKDERHYRMERSMGTFTRSITLPVSVDATNVTALFKNGLLTIRLPKTKAVKGAAIPVKVE